MFDIRKFGGYLSRLRKKADMTQSELADKLNVTRQAVSKYELGDSFPDVSILVSIAEIFGITVDDLIGGGNPSLGEAKILGHAAEGKTPSEAGNLSDVINLAPYLKPNMLATLSNNLAADGINLSDVVRLAEYLDDEHTLHLLEHATLDTLSPDLLERLIPLLDASSKNVILQKIMLGEMDWRLLAVLFPHAGYLRSPIEAAVLEGALPWEALKLLKDSPLREK